jgi:hypothetical protein
MRNTECTRRLLAGLVVILMVSTIASAQTPILTDQPTDEEIGAFVLYWTDALAAADSADDVSTAVDKLTGAFESQSTARYTFARLASKQLVVTIDELEDSDALAELKRVNAAMAVSQMPQVAIQDALQSLIVNPHPAVRYQGWVGYRAIRTLVLSQGGTAMTDMTADLNARLANETDPQVLNAIFDVLDLPSFRPESLPEETYNASAKAFMEAILANLPRYAKLAYTGDAECSDACGSAVAIAGKLFTLVKTTDPETTLSTEQLQNAFDAMTVAAEVYAQSPGDADQLLVETEFILRESENLINASTGLRENAIALALAEDDARETATPLATIAWAKALADFGVTDTALDDYAPESDTEEAPAE